MILDDQRLRIFRAVAECRSFTIAAQKLEMSQSAVSQCVADLERRAGASLFNRSKSGVSLTEKGETFKIFADRILKDYEDLDVVFRDYEAFASVAERLNALKDEPSFYLFKDILSR